MFFLLTKLMLNFVDICDCLMFMVTLHCWCRNLSVVIFFINYDESTITMCSNLVHFWLGRSRGLVLNKMLAFNCSIHLLFYQILSPHWISETPGFFWVKSHLFWRVNFLLLCLFTLFHVFLLVSKADFSLKKSWQGKICTEYGKTSPETSFFTWEKFPFIFHTSDPVFFSLPCDLSWHCGVVENLKRFVGSIQLITDFPLSLIIPWLDITCMLFWSFLWLAFGFQLCILWENHRIIDVML